MSSSDRAAKEHFAPMSGLSTLERLRELLAPLGTVGNLTTDAHLAALAIEHGAELCSLDADFSRFAGLRCVNPLEPSHRASASLRN